VESFPFGRVAKQLPYLQWIISTVEKVPSFDFRGLCGPVFGLLAELVTSDSSKVAEASLKMFQNLKLIPLMIDNSRSILPVVHAAVARIMTEHWKVGTQNHAFAAMRALHDLNPIVFEELRSEAKKKGGVDRAKSEPSEADQQTHRNWVTIARRAGQTDQSLVSAKTLATIARVFGKRNPGVSLMTIRW
jgi:hypothetical protein